MPGDALPPGSSDAVRGASASLFGLPDEAARETRLAIEVAKLASLVLTHELEGEVKGLDASAGKHPPVAPVFLSFRLMVGIGLLMLAVSWIGWWQLRPNSRRPEPSSLLTASLLEMVFSGWGACSLAGTPPKSAVSRGWSTAC